MRALSVLLFALFLGFTGNLYAQDSTLTNKEKRKAKSEARKEKKEQRLQDGKILVNPIVAPGYTPELGFLLAAGGLITWKTKKTDSLIQRSSFPFTISYTSTGAIAANGVLSTYWFQDRMRIYMDFWAKEMPDHYWGIGYNKAFANHEEDTLTAFTRTWIWVNPRILWQVRNGFFVGLNIDYNYTKGKDASTGVLADENYKVYNDRPFNSGFGLMIRYDSRDIPIDARKGMYFDLRATAFSPAFGGQNNYQAYIFDYRQYQSIMKPAHVLAWQVKSRLSYGEVGYGEMSLLGSPYDLRGYRWGRVRNNHMIFGLTEYRHTFYRKDGKTSRHAAVVWAGVGTAFSDDEWKSMALKWLPNVGIGYRFEVQPRMNLRLDYGFGKESNGFYINFNQAF